MHSTTWRDDYRKIAAELISSSPEISLPEVADRLAMPADLVADLLDHPMSGILQRWAQRAASKPTTCPSSRVWLERTNA